MKYPIYTLDIETYSDVDLRKYGVKAYANSLKFKVLCGVIRVDTETSYHYNEFSWPINANIEASILHFINERPENSTILVHNLSFEAECLDLDLTKHNYIDTAVLSSYRGWYRSLKLATDYFNPKMSKWDAGYKLAEKVGKMDYVEATTSKEYKDLINYCRSDVDLTFHLYKKLCNKN